MSKGVCMKAMAGLFLGVMLACAGCAAHLPAEVSF
jgi:phosphoribosylcarboxyaminoimidazole (NCAIR) mutase